MKTNSNSTGMKAAVWNRNWTQAWQHGKCWFLPFEQKEYLLVDAEWQPVTPLMVTMCTM